MTSWHEYHQYALENGGMDSDGWAVSRVARDGLALARGAQ